MLLTKKDYEEYLENDDHVDEETVSEGKNQEEYPFTAEGFLAHADDCENYVSSCLQACCACKHKNIDCKFYKTYNPFMMVEFIHFMNKHCNIDIGTAETVVGVLFGISPSAYEAAFDMVKEFSILVSAEHEC